MHFKSLELLGFKSFGDKTRFDFEPGVTAIVGPNGCGKSNVADAIRWVMGEQNARLLRGLRMEDVIFNGTDDRKPVGFAEVSLTLTGVDAHLSVDYNEITVTRRAFRSGEGQYLINKTPCRLKDIDDLFMGTGIGLSAYSIIEQGKIDMILSSKPEERRFIFEEAAGITRYKEKKREALRKLDSTQENLSRLSDIIQEVKRQLASVERQAARARRAREIADELKGHEVRFAAHRLAEIDARIRDAERERDTARSEEAEVRKVIADLGSEQGRLHEQLYTLDQRIGSVQARRMGVSGSIESNRSRVAASEKLVIELDEGEKRYAAEIVKFRESLLSLRAEEEALSQALSEAVRDYERADAELQAAEQEREKKHREVRESEAQTSSMRSELIDLINRLARQRNELADARQGARTAALRATKLRVEERELSERIDLARGDVEERRSARLSLDEVRSTAAREMEEMQQRILEARRAEDALQEERIGNEKALSHAESRHELLTRYRDSYEGYVDGVKAVMAEAGREGSELQGILGVVAEKIKAQPGYERALEVSVGYSLQMILSRSIDDALAALRFLRGGADASFLPLEGLAPPSDVGRPEGEGVLGGAWEFVSVEPAFTAAARYLLGATYFVTSLQEALALARGCAPGARIATLGGELIVANGPVAVAAGGRGLSSIVSRGNEIERLATELKSLHSQKGDLLKKMGEAGERRGALDTALSEAREKLRRGEIQCAEARTEEARSTASFESLQAELAAARAEASELEAVSRESSAEEHRLVREIAEGEKRQGEIENSLAAQGKELIARSRELEQSQSSVTELKVMLAGVKEKEHSRRSHLERLRRELATAEEGLRNRDEQRERMALRGTELAAENEALRKEIESLMEERETTDTDAQQHENEKASLYERQKDVDALLKEKSSSLEKIKDCISHDEVVLAQHEAERKNLIEKIRDQYSEDITLVQGIEEGSEWAEVEQRIQQLKEKLSRVGAVNMGALEEHDELAKRLTFLTEQEADLLNAKDSLEKAIHRINIETTRMFSQTFQAIQGHFKEIYRELFGGGSTDLILEEGASVLEAGIDIVARPPGKKLQNISLLSGGERALTAVALLFALFRVKPSPFCVLDEIDAPLDESNIDRFLRMLEKFLKTTQFIIVTHNKRTISMADVMYGITMEQSGVSKVVSVKFAKGHKRHPSRGEAEGVASKSDSAS
ncbi:MAG: chromosome segregation protein SMC [Candidatus Aureabacteria bacterium]|nr:chromosome segregation protein SMC [Candidatus Auribacterota bacterium]